MIVLSDKFFKNLLEVRNFDGKAIEELARAAAEFVNTGPALASDVESSDSDPVVKATQALAAMYLECGKADIDAEKFSKLLDASNLDIDQKTAITDVYRSEKNKISELLADFDGWLHYHDMQWRFEAKVGSRCLLNQIVPLVSMDLKLGDSPNAASTMKLSHVILQTDPTTLMRMADTLEKALTAISSRNVRKMEKQMKKLNAPR